MSHGRVLIVEDESIVRLHLMELVAGLGYEVVGEAGDAESAWRQASRHRPDLVLMDIHLREGDDGVRIAQRIMGEVDTGIIFVTAFADHEVVERTRAVGALGYVVKPYSEGELRAVLATAMTLREQMALATKRPSKSRDAGAPGLDLPELEFHGLIGGSQAMRDVVASIERVAPITWPVLIEGETGTGKELVARAIHAAGSRSRGPFVAVNCAALTDGLVGSTFFGHRKGSFTSASQDQVGVFEAAHGGTLFLDEIADIPAAAQSALLRLLEEQTVQRIGESWERKVDVRVLSATQRDLARLADSGGFRSDLLYRLRALRIQIPPLRERSGDIPALSRKFLVAAAKELGRPAFELPAEVMAILQGYDWPGNVRELKHAIAHAALATRGDRIEREHLPPELSLAARELQPLPADERARILEALGQARGNRIRAARILGMSRATLYRRFRELGIDPDDLSQ